MLVSVVGASGAIGHSAVTAFLDAGHGVRAVGRSARKLRAALGPRFAEIEAVTADITTAEGRWRTADRADAMLDTPGLLYRTRDFAQYPGITRMTLEACAKTSIRAFVHISNVYPYGVPRVPVVEETHALAPVGPKGRFRREQEGAVLGANSRVRFGSAVLRLPTVFGAHADNSILQTAAAAIVRRAPAPLLAPIDALTEHVGTEDVGPAIARLMGRQGRGGEAYNMAGTGLASQWQLVRLLMQAASVDVPLRVLPVWARRVLGLVVPILGELREVDYLMESSFVLSEAKLAAVIGGPVAHTPLPLTAERWILALGAGAAPPGRQRRESTGAP